MCMNNLLTRKPSLLVKISFGIVILLTIISIDVNAQIGRGCYVDGVLYTSNTSKGNRFFYRTPGNLSDPCGYVYTGSNDGQCRLYNSGPVGNNSSYTQYLNNFGNDWDVIACPIDDYVWLLIIALVGLAVFKFNIFPTLAHATKRR